MKKLVLVGLAILMLMPAATVVAQRGGGGGSRGGGGGWHGGGGSGGWRGGGGSWRGGGGNWRGGGGWRGGGRFFYSPFYADPYWGWGLGWGWGFGPYGFWGYYGPYSYYGGTYGGSRYGYVNASDWAVVDTDVSPEEARVFLDGRYIGLADDFDGHPDYLYLRPGNYSLEFRLEGYESATVSVNAKPGAKINLNNKLGKIPGAKQYGSYDTPQPEGGLQRYFGKKPDGTDEALDRSRRDPGNSRGRYRDGDGDRSNRDPNDVEATPDEVRRPPASGRGGSDLREEEWRQSRPRHGARLLLVIRPADAAVYLDDRFIGTADEVGGPDQAVPLSAGKHSVTVSRPGFKDRTVEVEVLAGEVKRVDVTLEK